MDNENGLFIDCNNSTSAGKDRRRLWKKVRGIDREKNELLEWAFWVQFTEERARREVRNEPIQRGNLSTCSRLAVGMGSPPSVLAANQGGQYSEPTSIVLLSSYPKELLLGNLRAAPMMSLLYFPLPLPFVGSFAQCIFSPFPS